MKRLRGREALEGYLFISPWVIGFVVFALGPLLAAVVISFTSWDLIGPAKSVGVENYRELARDPLIAKSLFNTFFYAAFAVPLGVAFALVLAVLLNTKTRGISIYRTIVYLPAVTSGVAIAILWKLLFNADSGLINEVLRLFGSLYEAAINGMASALDSRFTPAAVRFILESLRSLGAPEPPGWLSDPAWSKPALVVMSLWGVGAPTIIFLAGLQGIPRELYEAAQIDGAGKFGKFRHVSLPMLSPLIFFNLVMGFIGAMQIFVQVFIMTDGGPQDSTLFYVLYLFKQAFQYLKFGYGAAMAWLLFFIILGATLVQFVLSKRWVQYER